MKIQPVQSPLRGTVFVPGSKSLTNRAILIAALAEGDSVLEHALVADDTTHMCLCLKEMGVSIRLSLPHKRVSIRGVGFHLRPPRRPLFVGNSGTTMRFLTAVVAGCHGVFRLDGDADMRRRPIGDLTEALRGVGVDIQDANGHPPVTVRATGLPGGPVVVRGDTSSQYLSGLLIASPHARRPTRIRVEGELLSEPYVRLTVAMMKRFGAEVRVLPGGN